jgi:succinyl-CoA synthetase alpha subunit
VIYQGFTGRVATGNAKDSLEYGTNIVGGVTPGKEGEHLGLPLLPDLKKAKEQLKPDATAVFVAAPQCGKAIEDAIEAEIPLIVSVAEHIPLHDIMRVRFSFRVCI